VLIFCSFIQGERLRNLAFRAFGAIFEIVSAPLELASLLQDFGGMIAGI
jgi:hypothetical protein